MSKIKIIKDILNNIQDAKLIEILELNIRNNTIDKSKILGLLTLEVLNVIKAENIIIPVKSPKKIKKELTDEDCKKLGKFLNQKTKRCNNAKVAKKPDDNPDDNPDVVKPDVKPDVVKPVVKPDVVKPDDVKPVVKPVDVKPVVKPVVVKPVVKPVVVKPVVKPVVVKPVVVKPVVVKPVVVKPVVKPDVVKPDVVKPVVVKPVVVKPKIAKKAIIDLNNVILKAGIKIDDIITFDKCKWLITGSFRNAEEVVARNLANIDDRKTENITLYTAKLAEPILDKNLIKKYGSYENVIIKLQPRHNLTNFQITTEYHIMNLLEKRKCSKYSQISLHYGLYNNIAYMLVSPLYGKDLKDVHELKRIRIIIPNLLNALKSIHYCGIVHRDIKQENIAYADNDTNSEIKLIDFGLGDSIFNNKNIRINYENNTKKCAGDGTPTYMSTMMHKSNVMFYMDDIQCLAWMLYDMININGKDVYDNYTYGVPWKKCINNCDILADKREFIDNFSAMDNCKPCLRVIHELVKYTEDNYLKELDNIKVPADVKKYVDKIYKDIGRILEKI